MSEVSPELEFLPEVYIGVVVYFIIVSRAVGKARYPWGFWPHRVHAHVYVDLVRARACMVLAAHGSRR